MALAEAVWSAVALPLRLPPVVTVTASAPLTVLACTKAATRSLVEEAVAVEVVRALAARERSLPLLALTACRPTLLLKMRAAGSP